jgi:hypothetical protein
MGAAPMSLEANGSENDFSQDLLPEPLACPPATSGGEAGALLRL